MDNKNKMVEIPEDIYKGLMELAKEYVSQDNRATAMPYLFQIRTTEEVVAVKGSGEECWFDTEGRKLSKNDIRDVIGNFKGWSEKGTKRMFDKLDEEEIEYILETHLEYRKINIQEESRYQNAFFTEKACKQHIRENSYHYNKPVDYLNHSWRNPEMDLISNLLVHLAKQTNAQYCVYKVQIKKSEEFNYWIEPKFIANKWYKKDIIFTGTYKKCLKYVLTT